MPRKQSSTPPRGFTAKYIESLRPRESRYALFDRGLQLRVMPSGQKVFRWMVRDQGTGKLRAITIGTWTTSELPGHVTLAQAREWLARLKTGHAAGTLAEVEAELEKGTAPKPALSDRTDLVRDLAEVFYQRRILPQRKAPEDARRSLDADIIRVLGNIPVREVTTPDCARLIESVVDRGSAGRAGKVLGLTKQLFTFAEAKGLIDRNPAAPLRADDLGVISRKKKRALDEAEIPLFWHALKEAKRMPEATRIGLRLLLLTAVRSGELLKAKWSEVNLKAGTWTIPVANQKLTKKQEHDARPFVVPLAPLTLSLFKDLGKITGKATWLLPADMERVRLSGSKRTDGPYSDRALTHAVRRLFETKRKGGTPVLELPGGQFSPHDLRRTARTHLGKLRVPSHIAELCLNHRLGRIVQVYDQGDYLEERREAMEKWAAYVERLLDPASNVVSIQTEARP